MSRYSICFDFQLLKAKRVRPEKNEISFSKNSETDSD